MLVKRLLQMPRIFLSEGFSLLSRTGLKGGFGLKNRSCVILERLAGGWWLVWWFNFDLRAPGLDNKGPASHDRRRACG